MAPDICNYTKHKTLSPFLLCCGCLDREEGIHGLRIHTGQIRWGGALNPLPVEPSVCGAESWPFEIVDVSMARPGMVRRLRSWRVGQRPKGERGTDCLLHWRLVTHTWEGDLGRSWARAAQEKPISQHTPYLRVAHTATQNTRRAKVSCTCKTTGILGETGWESGMPPGTSSLPPWQCSQTRKAQVGVRVWPSAWMSL